MGCTREIVCVVMLGLGFMLVFTAFQTMGNIEKTILNSLQKDDPDFKGDGYTSLAIIYAVFALCNWLAPSVISLIGPRISMVIGGVTYTLFIMSFLMPRTWLLYLASVIIGVGAALIWTGQGNYLTLSSRTMNMTRNSGIFWALLQLSLFFGNLFVFFVFEGKDHIDHGTRTLVFWVLTIVAVCGIVVLLLLPKPKGDEEDATQEIHYGPVDAFINAMKLFATKKMLLLTVAFFYTGIELGFFSGVYSSSVGFTKQFGDQAKQLVGLSGIFIGVGEVLGGSIFGIFGSKTRRFGRDPVVIGGFIIHVVCFFLIFLNLPNSSPFEDTDEEAFIKSNAILAILCSFLLGLGDACYNTQIFSILGDVYADNSAPAFAIFKFMQSVASALSFVYASLLGLYIQLAILFVCAIFGTFCFVYVEWGVKKQRREEISQVSESE